MTVRKIASDPKAEVTMMQVEKRIKDNCQKGRRTVGNAGKVSIIYILILDIFYLA